MIELRGHRSLGGCRASLYVPVPQIAIDKLANFMEEYIKWIINKFRFFKKIKKKRYDNWNLREILTVKLIF